MLNNITIGQYFPGNSFLHRMDPRAKIIATTIFVVAIFLANSPLAYGIGLSSYLLWGFIFLRHQAIQFFNGGLSILPTMAWQWAFKWRHA